MHSVDTGSHPVGVIRRKPTRQHRCLIEHELTVANTLGALTKEQTQFCKIHIIVDALRLSSTRGHAFKPRPLIDQEAPGSWG